MTRRLVAEEGIFAGASCGAALAGAMKYLRKHDREGMVAVVVLPDSAKNYLSKVFNDRWMEENGFMEPPTVEGTVSDLLHSKSKREVITIEHTTTVVDAVETLKKYDFSQAPVVDGESLLGILTEKSLLHHAIKGHAGQDMVRELIDMDFCVVHEDTELYVLMELFSRFETALVYEDKKPCDIITRIDLIDYMSRSKKRR